MYLFHNCQDMEFYNVLLLLSNHLSLLLAFVFQVKSDHSEKILQLLQNYDMVKHDKRLLMVSFTSLSDYMWYLRSICQRLGGIGSRVMLYLAAAVSDFSLMWSAPIPDVWPKALSMLEEFRKSFSMLLGPSASSEEIGLVDSVTSGFLRIIDGLGSDYLEGKSILIADDAFPSLHFLLQGMQKLLKFNIRRVAIRQGQYHVENSDYIKELKNEDVALALVTWVSSTTSAMMDLEAIAIEAPESCILAVSYTHLTLPTNREV